MIGTRYDSRNLYHLETDVDYVTSVSFTLRELHCWFNHPTLQILKELVLMLSQASSHQCVLSIENQ